MKFKMNDIEWEIKEVELKELQSNDNFYNAGETHYAEQEIWLYKELKPDHKRRTLIHELCHLYVFNYITSKNIEYDEELLCDICANSHDIIHKIAEDYFKGE